MSYYSECPNCHATLDPNEKCKCLEEKEKLEKKYEQLTTVAKDGQIIFGGIEHELCTG